MLFLRGYIAADRQKLDDALNFLNQAVALNGGNWQAYRERAYVLGEFERHREALADLERALALSPDDSSIYEERAWARNHLADFEGVIADSDRLLAKSPENINMLASKANSLLWLGKDREAAATIRQLAGLENDVSDKREPKLQERLAAYRDQSPTGDAKALCRDSFLHPERVNTHGIGDCTKTFLLAKRAKEKAEILTWRSVAWLTLKQNEGEAMADRQIAIALEPKNPDLHSNLGFSYLGRRHSWAARNAFDRALAINPKHYIALAGRASANFNLGSVDTARRDAVQSAKIKLNPAATQVLGNIAHEVDKDDVKARQFWMATWKLGVHDEGLRDQLKSIGVSDPDASAL
jgi:tetratricopeptide (TPR) repeat protein